MVLMRKSMDGADLIDLGADSIHAIIALTFVRSERPQQRALGPQ